MSRSVFFTSALIILMSTFVLSGCGQSPEAAAQGRYELDQERIKADMQAEIDAMEDSQEKVQMEMMAGFLGDMSMTLMLKEEGIAAFTTSIMGQADEQVGTWSIDGEAISITMNADGDGSDTISGTLRDGVLELSSPDGDEMPFPMVFNRVEE